MERNLDQERYMKGHFAWRWFADGVVLMMKGRFEEARKYLNEAYDMLVRNSGNPDDPDARHVKLFQVILMLAEGNMTQARTQEEFRHAEGMMEYWQAQKLTRIATNILHIGESQEAFARNQQAVIYYKKADYGSVVGVFNEAEAQQISNRAAGLPETLSNFMMGGGYTQMGMDPFGTSPLPSECSRAL